MSGLLEICLSVFWSSFTDEQELWATFHLLSGWFLVLYGFGPSPSLSLLPVLFWRLGLFSQFYFLPLFFSCLCWCLIVFTSFLLCFPPSGYLHCIWFEAGSQKSQVPIRFADRLSPQVQGAINPSFTIQKKSKNSCISNTAIKVFISESLNEPYNTFSLACC